MKIRWQMILIALISTSTILIWGTAYLASDVLGNLQWLLYGAGFSALSGIFLLKGNMGTRDSWLRQEQTALESREKNLAEQEKHFRQTRKELEDELQRRSVMPASDRFCPITAGTFLSLEAIINGLSPAVPPVNSFPCSRSLQTP